MKRPNVYFAAPLFSDAERTFNTHVASRLADFFDVYLPQEDGGLLVEMIADGMPPHAAANTVFNLDVIALKSCDILLIVLDGRSVDEGAAFELGFAHALQKPCFALQTDPRRLLQTGNNPMVDCALQQIFTTVDDLTSWARSYSQDHTNNCRGSAQHAESMTNQ